MISRLRERDRLTLTAEGPKFDLPKVLDAGRRIIQMLAGRSSMRFPDEFPAELELEEGNSLILDETAIEVLAETFLEISREAFDAADLLVPMAFGPYRALWAPLGMSALFGPVGNCVTIYEEPWEDLDVTPMILLQSRNAPLTLMGRPATKFLAETFRTEPYGTTIDFIPDDSDADTVAIRFPHADFGAGSGRIRICRYLDPGSGSDEEDGS